MRGPARCSPVRPSRAVLPPPGAAQTFSPDGRWLVTTSMDSTVRVWDLPSGRTLDWFRVEMPATSVSFSPTGDFLATVHVDSLGVFLWSNSTLYTGSMLQPLASDAKPSLEPLPMTIRDTDDGVTGADTDADGPDPVVPPSDLIAAAAGQAPLLGPEQLDEHLITLSTLPRTRWLTLVNLDVIKVGRCALGAVPSPSRR